LGGGLKVVVVLEIAETREVEEVVEVVETSNAVEAGAAVETHWHVLEGLKMTNPGMFWPMLFMIQL